MYEWNSEASSLTLVDIAAILTCSVMVFGIGSAIYAMADVVTQGAAVEMIFLPGDIVELTAKSGYEGETAKVTTTERVSRYVKFVEYSLERPKLPL